MYPEHWIMIIFNIIAERAALPAHHLECYQIALAPPQGAIKMIPKCRPLIAGGFRCGGVAVPLCLCIDLKLNVNCGNSNDARGKEQLPAGTSTRAGTWSSSSSSSSSFPSPVWPSSAATGCPESPGVPMSRCPGFLLNHATAIKPRSCSHCSRMQPVSLTRRQSSSHGQ